MVYVKSNGGAFFNPAPSMHGNVDPEIGSSIDGCTAVARGDLQQAEAIVSAINATLPPMPAFGEMLES